MKVSIPSYGSGSSGCLAQVINRAFILCIITAVPITSLQCHKKQGKPRFPNMNCVQNLPLLLLLRRRDNTEHRASLAVPCSWKVCRNHQFTAAGAVGKAAAGGGRFPREAPSAHSMAGGTKRDRQKLGMDVCWVLLTACGPRCTLCSGLPEAAAPVPAGASAGSAEGCLGAAPLCLAALSRPLAVLTRATWTLFFL